MTVLGLALAAGGVVLVAVGYTRARGPWRRYQGLKAQDENAARYRAWRGGPAASPDEKTGASVAMAILRREVRTWAAVAAVGAALIVGGLVLAAR